MQAVRFPRLRLASGASLSLLLARATMNDDDDPSRLLMSLLTPTLPTLRCEAAASPPTATSISWLRRQLYRFHLQSLPLPRRLVPGDPALTVDARCLGRRQREEGQLRIVQQQLQAALPSGDRQRIGPFIKQTYDLLYGEGVTPRDRQDFLERYGCTGWTNEVLDALIDLAGDRGVVEIGAGNGQWARALMERYQQRRAKGTSNKPFDFVLAYDNMSELPLNPDVYHSRTKPYHDYFYDKVQPCPSIQRILQQWPCRGRVLLLVYPSPDNMAADALAAYTAIGDVNDTVVYVGEGRGGANANAGFFDALESGDWVLERILPVQAFGEKGYERLYVFRRVLD